MDSLLSPTRAPTSRYTPKQICDVFFKPVLDNNDGCMDAKRGNTNLLSHVLSQLHDYEATLDNFRGGNNETVLSFVDKKSATVFGWPEWISCANLPLSFYENELTRRYTSLGTMCDYTLILYIVATCTEVLRVISDYHPAEFGIHYLAVFAAFGHDDKQESVLLAMAPLLGKEACVSNPHHDADAHIAYLKTILKPVKRHIEYILHKINELMKFLRGLNQAAKHYSGHILTKRFMVIGGVCGLHRQRTPLQPATRWSTTFAMVERYFKLKPFLDSVDDELAVYMPSPLEEKRLRGDLDDLKDFESVSKILQEESGLTLADFPIFERACVQVQNRETWYLTRDAIAALAPFASQGTSTSQSPASSNSAKKLSFAEQALKKRRMQDQQQPSRYELVHYIPPTSNAGMVLSPLRQAMAPTQLENILFLKMNRRFWNMATVQTAGKQI
ncbi:Ribonuclease H-like domain [Phytophthora cactorum]|nr:Ribonuclease H-like domain [Phytophthora cactorum]